MRSAFPTAEEVSSGSLACPGSRRAARCNLDEPPARRQRAAGEAEEGDQVLELPRAPSPIAREPDGLRDALLYVGRCPSSTCTESLISSRQEKVRIGRLPHASRCLPYAISGA